MCVRRATWARPASSSAVRGCSASAVSRSVRAVSSAPSPAITSLDSAAAPSTTRAASAMSSVRTLSFPHAIDSISELCICWKLISNRVV